MSGVSSSSTRMEVAPVFGLESPRKKGRISQGATMMFINIPQGLDASSYRVTVRYRRA